MYRNYARKTSVHARLLQIFRLTSRCIVLLLAKYYLGTFFAPQKTGLSGAPRSRAPAPPTAWLLRTPPIPCAGSAPASGCESAPNVKFCVAKTPTGTRGITRPVPGDRGLSPARGLSGVLRALPKTPEAIAAKRQLPVYLTQNAGAKEIAFNGFCGTP
jgi:hypothetical protein